MSVWVGSNLEKIVVCVLLGSVWILSENVLGDVCKKAQPWCFASFHSWKKSDIVLWGLAGEHCGGLGR